MGTVRLSTKARAIQLRRAGRSYDDILTSLNLKSKGTLHFWFKNIQLSQRAVNLLQRKAAFASRNNLQSFNAARSKRVNEENEREYLSGQTEVGSISGRELMLIGAALYWGEGTKSENQRRNPVLALTNADASLIALYMRFLREVLEVPNASIRGGIHLYPSTNVLKARRHWSHITKLPEDRFYIVRMVSRSSARKKSPRLLPYGTITIRVHRRVLFHRVKGMINALSRSSLYT